jgi:hypothetical protein
MDVPASLRRWFVAHFGVNLLIGAPLLLVPETFLRALGWSTIDGSSARFGGAALLAVGVQSLLTRDAGVSTLRMMLNFKLVWSWAVITGLVFAAADDAPDPVWVLLAFFLGLSSVWFHFRMQLEGEYAEDEDHDQDALPAGGDELSELLHLESMAANAQQGHATNSFDSMGAQDINSLFAAQQAEEARKAAAEAAAEAAKRKAAEEAAEEASESEQPARRTMQGLSPAKRAEMDELDALLAASASTGIDDKKAERLADLLASRKAAREAAAGVLEDEAPSAQAPDPEALGEDDIAAMLAKGPDEATMGEGDIAAMLANGPEEKTLGEGDIAAMLAGNDDDDSMGGDDIAAMLAGNDAPTEKRAADEGASAADEAQATEDQAAEDQATEDQATEDQATEADEPPAQEAVAVDAPDAEELAVVPEAAPPEAAAPEAAPPEAAAPDEDAPAGSDEIAAMLAGKDENVSSEDLAALLAGNEGGSSEPPSLPTLRGRAESALELEDHDEAILFADDPPPPEPTEAVQADVVDAPPGDTLDEAAGEDAIAAMLAASRAEDAKAES